MRDSFIHVMGVASGVVLGVYLISLLYDLYSPRGKAAKDPSSPGCLGMMAIITVGLGVLLLVGFWLKIRFIIALVSALTIVPVVFLVPEIVLMTLRDWRNRNRK